MDILIHRQLSIWPTFFPSLVVLRSIQQVVDAERTSKKFAVLAPSSIERPAAEPSRGRWWIPPTTVQFQAEWWWCW